MNFRKTLISISAIGAGFVALIFLLGILMPNSIFDFGFEKMHVLPESTAPIVGVSKLEGPAGDEDKLRFVVGLNLRDEAALDKYIEEVNDPASSNYGKYLTPQDIRSYFSPTTDDVDLVIEFLKDSQMTVLSVSDNRTLIYVEGTVAQIEDAFDVEMNRYSVRDDRGLVHYVSNASDPSIPARLDSIIQGIMGLNTYAEFKSNALEQTADLKPNAPTLPRGLSPQDVASVYDFPNANNPNAKSRYTGKGKTLAIATAYTYDPDDMRDYWKQYGIVRTGQLKNIYINGKATDINSETTLDLQAASSQAPGADILMYMSVDAKFVNFTMTFNQVVTDNDADVMSVSWGLCESFTGKRQMKLEHTIFKQAAAQGIAIFVASGDYGAYDCRVPPQKDEDGNLVVPPLDVDYPSSDPHITAVGGTTLFDGQGNRILEYAWKGSGGGESGLWKRPSWQHGPGVPASTYRNTADVALNADPMTGYSFRFEGKWVVYGGTSVGAPEWAALWILVDEAAGKRIGNPNKLIYEMGRSADYGKLFYDITRGDNGNNWGPGFKAGNNWDHPTGWGVPEGEALTDWVVKSQKP